MHLFELAMKKDSTITPRDFLHLKVSVQNDAGLWKTGEIDDLIRPCDSKHQQHVKENVYVGEFGLLIGEDTIEFSFDEMRQAHENYLWLKERNDLLHKLTPTAVATI